MRRARTETFLTQRYEHHELARMPDELIVEEPLSIELDGVLVATTMRTPGHDFELAVGFCHADGLLAGAPVRQVKYCGTGSAVDTDFNVVTVDTGGVAPPPVARLGTTSSSCGLCGSLTIDTLRARLSPVAAAPFPLDVLAAAPVRMRAEQRLFDSTGAVHAAAAFDRQGQPVVVREDIGRHNAVDKVVGRLLLDGRLPASELALFVSGRASFEMVQKAWAGGFGAVVAVSAPSALAVDTARAAGMTLAGFARNGRMTLYAPATQVG
ncbi:MAG TPA: formate dehydrogenase accessory sulfurtransferase FdhD [Acidimicrobiales bacterium]|jgi:FdhD protein|nr:formate dehydrogenase accessory sulfurtransferase FdhD [Acidimicrobiales bacterium]